MYYVRNNHPAIISHAVFNQVQTEIARRNSKRSPSETASVTGQGRHSRYALSDILHCAECGSKYRRQVWTVKGEKVPVWRCCNRLDNGTKYCKSSPTLKEHDLHAAIVRAINTFSGDSQVDFQKYLADTVASAIGMNEDSDEADLLARRIEMLNQEMMALVDVALSAELSVEDNEEKFKAISEEIGQLTERLEAVRASGKTEEQRQEQNRLLQQSIEQLQKSACEYHDTTVRQMVECIKVHHDGKLEIIFNGGYTVTEQIEL